MNDDRISATSYGFPISLTFTKLNFRKNIWFLLSSNINWYLCFRLEWGWWSTSHTEQHLQPGGVQPKGNSSQKSPQGFVKFQWGASQLRWICDSIGYKIQTNRIWGKCTSLGRWSQEEEEAVQYKCQEHQY